MHVSSYYIFVYMLVGDNNSCDDTDDPPINSHNNVDSNAKITSEKNAIQGSTYIFLQDTNSFSLKYRCTNLY